jgi:ferredoxin-type protein NapH
MNSPWHMTPDDTRHGFPIRVELGRPRGSGMQRKRRLFQAAFFLLFVLAPPLDLFRYDLNLGHMILFGMDWTLGLDPLLHGQASAHAAAANLVLRGLLPIITVVALLAWASWKYGRLYCGWLCPHFSVVETVNGLLRRAIGKPSVWERKALPETRADGRHVAVERKYWLVVVPAVVGFAFLWALTLLTYLLTPAEVYANLLHGTLTRNQSIFLTAATVVLAVEFLLARHLFCRFGCAVGVFQSFLWMANKRAMVVGFDRARAVDCRSCDNQCEHACPMRLKPRSAKRMMFTCTECARCVDACAAVQAGGPGNSGKMQTPLLQWVRGGCALDTSDHSLGRRPLPVEGCFRR